MYTRKLFWAIRGLFCRMTFGRFGSFSYIGKPLKIQGKGNIYVDNKVRIQPGIRMETDSHGIIHIAENTSIGQNVHLTASGEVLEIGKNTTILGNVFITNTDHEYREIGIHVLKQKHIVKTTRIGENCFIGYGACIQAGTILGKQCVVGANAVVRGCFPDYSVIVGVPGHIIKQYSSVTKMWEKTNDELG